MYKIYFKQAIEMLKQNKFISIVTIAGTALAIMMIMVIVVSESIKQASIPPELNRDRTMYLLHQTLTGKNGGGVNNSPVTYPVYKAYLSELKIPEQVTALTFARNNIVTNPDQEKERKSAKLRAVDANFWKVMSFSFTGGKPFTEEDFNAGLKKAVISESLAKRLYGDADAVGKIIKVSFEPYTVTGVVKDVSQTFLYAQADVYIPYTSYESYERYTYMVLLVAKDKKDFALIDGEIRAAERAFNAADANKNLELYGPLDHAAQVLWYTTGEELPDIKKNTRKMIFVLSILLLVPAINLSSFSLSRIKKRTEEIGIRKAFGAKKYIILVQVLYENFITSLIGGIIGLLLSYLVIVWLKQWLLGVSSNLPVEMFVSWPIFVAVFVASMLLNLLSAGIPAYRASRINIVNSLHKNQES